MGKKAELGFTVPQYGTKRGAWRNLSGQGALHTNHLGEDLVAQEEVEVGKWYHFGANGSKQVARGIRKFINTKKRDRFTELVRKQLLEGCRYVPRRGE